MAEADLVDAAGAGDEHRCPKRPATRLRCRTMDTEGIRINIMPPHNGGHAPASRQYTRPRG